MALLSSEVGAANTASIRLCCFVTIGEARQPLVGSEEADPCLCREIKSRDVLLNVQLNLVFTSDGCQPSQWVAMHGV